MGRKILVFFVVIILVVSGFVFLSNFMIEKPKEGDLNLIDEIDEISDEVNETGLLIDLNYC